MGMTQVINTSKESELVLETDGNNIYRHFTEWLSGNAIMMIKIIQWMIEHKSHSLMDLTLLVTFVITGNWAVWNADPFFETCSSRLPSEVRDCKLYKYGWVILCQGKISLKQRPSHYINHGLNTKAQTQKYVLENNCLIFLAIEFSLQGDWNRMDWNPTAYRYTLDKNQTSI